MTEEFENPSDDGSDDSGLPQLYQHTVKDEWGLAIMAWERDGKRGYQFEDGKLRVFKDGYYQLMKEVDRPLSDAAAVVADLNRQLGRAEQRQLRKDAGVEGKALLSFSDQVKIFRVLHPDGFEDATWKSDVRGEGAPRRLKRHRQPSIDEAKELLSQQSLQAKLDEEDYSAICADIFTVYGGTDLVGGSASKTLKDLPAESRGAVAKGIFDLLYGEDAFPSRFNRWVRALRSARIKVSWQIATLASALVFPDRHVCVRPSAFREQAAWMAPRLQINARPTADSYERLLEMAMAVGAKLGEAGEKPRDLVDIYDFMWATLRPAARKVLVEAPDTAAEQSEASGAKASGAANAEDTSADASPADAST